MRLRTWLLQFDDVFSQHKFLDRKITFFYNPGQSSISGRFRSSAAFHLGEKQLVWTFKSHIDTFGDRQWRDQEQKALFLDLIFATLDISQNISRGK
jgi:hypothetical protein